MSAIADEIVNLIEVPKVFLLSLTLNARYIEVYIKRTKSCN